MLCDFHIHTSFSGDCREAARNQIEQAMRLGIRRMCITDHHDYGDPFLSLDLDAYLTELKKLQEEYRDRIRLELGIELGLQNRYKDYLEQLVNKYRFDFIIGSHHYIRGLDPIPPSYWIGRNNEDELRHYFTVVGKRVREMDCFDSLGHLDYIVRYCPGLAIPYDPSPYMPELEEILKLLIQKGKALECNTGGFRYAIAHSNPCMAILQRYRAMGGELLTLGSDAHRAEDVGGGFEKSADMLREIGFKYYTVYHDRKPEMLPLS